MINKHLDHFKDKVTTVCENGPVILYDAVRCMTMDIISEFCLGKSANLIDEDPGRFNASWPRIFDKQIYVLAEFRY